MAQRLFDVAKIGVFLDGYTPATEKRRGEDVTVLKLSCRVAPFDAKLATAVDDGVGEESNVRATLFRLNHPDPKPHLDRVNFGLGCPRQNFTVFASPDTEAARIVFEQVKISDVYARTQKDRNGFDFCFKAALGPVGRDELEYVHSWFLSQRFVTFAQSEESLDFVDDGDDLDDGETDADEKAREVVDGRPAPMWEPERESEPAADAEPANRKLHTIAGGKKKTAGKKQTARGAR